MTRSSNCLENIQCPHCGNASRFKIVALVTADVCDDGAEFHGDAEWGDDSPITCPQCDRSGTVGDFTLPSLQPAIKRNRSTTSATHTPEPWDAGGLTVLYATPDGADVMTMIEIRAKVTESGWDTVAFIEAIWPNARANARLVAASPKLLDALLNIKRLAEKSGDHEADPFALLDLIAHEARATIQHETQE